MAGSIQIDFDLTGSSVSLLGGILVIPPDGTITTATARVTVPGSSISSPSAGPAQLSSLQFAATVNGTVGSAVLITGAFTASQIGGGGGSLGGGLTTLSIVSILLNLNGTVNCVGGQCTALGSFPATAVNSPLSLSGIAPFAIGGLGTSGAGTLSGVLSFNLGGNNVVANLVGQEISRVFLPEPASGMLVGLGLLVALGVGHRRARPS